MAKTNFVPILVLFVIICANHLIHANIKEDANEFINGIISRKMDVDRQGFIGSSLFGGPLAIAAFLLSLPALPALLMAPLAVAGLRPTIGAVGQFMNSINSGAGLSQGIAALLTQPNVDTETAASNLATSTSNAGSLNAPTSPFTSALRSISELIFSRRLSQQFFNRTPPKQPKPPVEPTDSKPGTDSSGESPQVRLGSLMLSLKEVYGILRNGLRRYEITDSDCQSRIICEIHQKAVGRSVSLGSFTANLMDIIGVEKHLEGSQALNEKAKSFIKDFVRAAKTGLSHNDCSSVFSRCPSTPVLELPHLPNFNRKNGINRDYLKTKPHIYDINQLSLLHSKAHKPNRLAIKTTFAKTPQTVNYYSNIKQTVI